MKKFECKELYRLPVTFDLTKDVFDMGFLFGEKREILSFIENESLSLDLRVSWVQQYMEEFHEKLKPITENIRQKLKLMDLENIITLDYETGEIVVLDITKTEYEKLYKMYNHMFSLVYKG
jgi:hypothetical protein